MGGIPLHVFRCFGRFDLDIGLAIADQLGSFLDDLVPEPLSNAAAIAAIPGSGGIYRLHYQGVPVYVGKADSLRLRLSQHAGDFDGRRNITRQAVSFVCATLSKNWSPFGAEDILMRQARLAWQNSGFGNNDPGRRRDQSVVSANHWDALYPIRLDWNSEFRAGDYSAADLLEGLKGSLPFLLRFEREGQGGYAPHFPEVLAATITLPVDNMPFWDIMALIVAELPGWQATALPGYAILYRGIIAYPSAIATIL